MPWTLRASSMAEPIAATERLILRDWDETDEHRFYAIMNTPAVMQHLGGVQTPEAWHGAFERLQRYQREFGHTFWIVEDKVSREMLGFCGLKRVNSPGAGELTGTPEIGWRLRESAWGRAIAKEAAIASRSGFWTFWLWPGDRPDDPAQSRKPGPYDAPWNDPLREPRFHRPALRRRGQSADRLCDRGGRLAWR
jgi:hypothetical protein